MKKINPKEITDGNVPELSENINDVVENSDAEFADDADIEDPNDDNDAEEQDDDPDYLIKFIQQGDDAFEAGDFETAAKHYGVAGAFISEVRYYCNYRLGWIFELKGKYESALKKYNEGIAEKDDYPYLYFMKGCLLKKHLGKQEEGELCLRKCIELEDGYIGSSICSHHAYAELGMRDQAMDMMTKLLKTYYYKAEVYFDAACMYCKLQNYDLALDYLGTALGKGYSMQHVLFDKDIDALRGFEKYQKIIDYCQDLPFGDAPYNDMSVIISI